MNINKWISALAAIAVTSAIAIAAQQTIGVGTVANDGTGDPLRTAFGKANDNFTELYARPQGTVTSIATACGVTGGTITTTGTIQGAITANAQTGTSYTPLATDCGKLVTISNASAIAITLTNANFSAGNFFEARVLPASVGAATFTPSSGTIDAGATLVLQPGQGTVLIFDGTNWQTMGQYTTGPSSSTAGNLPSFTGTGGQRLQDSGVAVANVATGPGSAVSGDLPSFNGTGGKTLQDSGVLAANVVQGPASAVSGNIATYNGTGGKTIQDGGVAVGNAGLDLHPGYISGNSYPPLPRRSIVTGVAGAIQTVYCAPAYVAQTLTIAKLGVLVPTTVGTTNFNLAVYSNVSGRPGSLLASTGNFVNTGTGALSGAVSQQLSKGVEYWFCQMTGDATAVMNGYSATNNGGGVDIGAASGSETVFMTNAAVVQGVSCSASCNGGTPTSLTFPSNLAGTTWSNLTNARAPAIWFNITSVP